MAYSVRRTKEIGAGVRAAAAEQAAKAVEAAETEEPHEAIHEIRRRCKKIRALLRLARPALRGYRAENVFFRDTARLGAGLRDAEAIIETLDGHRDELGRRAADAPLDALREALVARLEELGSSTDPGEVLSRMAERMREGRARLLRLEVKAETFEPLAEGLGRTYARGREAMRAARREPTPENLHEWRKRVKYHRYHARLLRGLWPEVLNPYRDETKRLSDLLGANHDLHVLRATMAEASIEGAETLDGPIRDLRHELAEQAFVLGRRVFAQKPEGVEALALRLWEGPGG